MTPLATLVRAVFGVESVEDTEGAATSDARDLGSIRGDIAAVDEAIVRERTRNAEAQRALARLAEARAQLLLDQALGADVGVGLSSNATEDEATRRIITDTQTTLQMCDQRQAALRQELATAERAQVEGAYIAALAEQLTLAQQLDAAAEVFSGALRAWIESDLRSGALRQRLAIAGIREPLPRVVDCLSRLFFESMPASLVVPTSVDLSVTSARRSLQFVGATPSPMARLVPEASDARTEGDAAPPTDEAEKTGAETRDREQERVR